MKNEFISVVSHELRTPLTTILGISKLLQSQSQTVDAETYVDFLTRITEQAEHLTKMVEQMIQTAALHAREAETRPKEFAFRSRGEDVVNSMHLGTVVVRWDIPDDLPLIRADDELIADILRNLLDNAVKYSPEGGTCTVGARAEGEALRFWVADEGIGMTQEQIQHIFEPFWQADSSNTRKFGGMGLGLHVVRLLASIIGAQVTVDSAPGSGTKIEVVLEPESVRTEAHLVGAR